jgi:hypothetical protein
MIELTEKESRPFPASYTRATTDIHTVPKIDTLLIIMFHQRLMV